MNAKNLAMKLLSKTGHEECEVRIIISHRIARRERSEYKIDLIKHYNEDNLIVLCCRKIKKIRDFHAPDGYVEFVADEDFMAELDEICNNPDKVVERAVPTNSVTRKLSDGSSVTITKGLD